MLEDSFWEEFFSQELTPAKTDRRIPPDEGIADEGIA
jgi:hypothetical protein